MLSLEYLTFAFLYYVSLQKDKHLTSLCFIKNPHTSHFLGIFGTSSLPASNQKQDVTFCTQNEMEQTKTEREERGKRNKILAWKLKTVNEIVTGERSVQHLCSFPFQWDGFTVQLMPWNKNSVGGQEKQAFCFAVNPLLKIQERKKPVCNIKKEMLKICLICTKPCSWCNFR